MTVSCQLCNSIRGHAPDCPDGDRAQDGIRARIEVLEKRVEKLYADLRDYVHTLEYECADLVDAAKRHVTEIDQRDADIARMRPVYEAACRMRANVPVGSAAEMRDRGFHPTTCDMVEEVDRAIASKPASTPYRGAP